MGIAIVIAAVAVLLVVLIALWRSRVQSRRSLAAAQAETAELRQRLDALAERLEENQRSMIRRDDTAYVITDAGQPALEPTVPDRVVLSATLGEPLVKAVSFAHGVRRALSPEVRNRIWFEMRREVRSSRRRRRRREMKEFVRQHRAAERASESDAERAA